MRSGSPPVDAASWLPTRARLFDTSENITTVDFHHIEINKDVNPKDFGRPETPGDWEVIIHGKENDGKASPSQS